MPQKTGDNVELRHQADRLIEKLFSKEAVPESEFEKIRVWLGDEGNTALDGEALRRKFVESVVYEPHPRYAYEMWPDLYARLGMDESLIKMPETSFARNGKKGARVRPRWGAAFRVAAVVIPLLTIAAAAGLLLDRNGRHTTGDGIAEAVTIVVGAGDPDEITLTDGTAVKAKPGSRIAYHAGDFLSHRDVGFEGEAFFSVAADAEHPFTVECGGMTVTVLGTEFNVKSYDGAECDEVALISGSVSVETGGEKIILEPMQRINIYKDSGRIEIVRISEGEKMRILGMPLTFTGETFGRAFELVGGYFDVDMIFAEEMNTAERIFVEFNKNTSLEEVLYVLRMTYPKFKYSLGIETVTISPN